MPDPKWPEQTLILDPFEKYKTVYRARNYDAANNRGRINFAHLNNIKSQIYSLTQHGIAKIDEKR